MLIMAEHSDQHEDFDNKYVGIVALVIGMVVLSLGILGLYVILN